MENQAHVGILKQGVGAWNSWRNNNKDTRPDLRGADLNGADLPGADLSSALLYGAKLVGANLRDADLSEAYLLGVHLHGAILTGANLCAAEMCGAFLLKADLCDADLSDVDLSQANLSAANLSRANLSEANLRGTVLREVLLDQARLTGVDLSDADLGDANLRSADLSWANLRGCKLSNTDFSESNIGRTNFTYLDLTGAMNLETVRPLAPSEIGFQTFVKSRGKPIPRAFLDACGVPDHMLEYIPSFAVPPYPLTRRHSCFLSHAVKDEEFVSRLYRGLRDAGVECWYAPEDLRIGDEFREAIHLSIERNDKLLLVLSENSIRSDWVEEEVNRALAEERKRCKDLSPEERAKRLVLFPIAIDDSAFECDDIPWVFNLKQKRHIGDFRKGMDDEKAMKRLLRDLNAETAMPE